MAAWPRMSSGLVGSSIQYGRNSARAVISSMASFTPQTLLASIMSCESQPMSERMRLARRESSSIPIPTFILNAVKPSAIAPCTSSFTCSSGYPAQPVDVVYAGNPTSCISVARVSLVGAASVRISRASSGVRASST